MPTKAVTHFTSAVSSQAPKVYFYILVTLTKWKETGCLSNYLWQFV